VTGLVEISDLFVALPSDGSFKQILSGVSLSIEEGSIYGLVGESGAGKSMTGRALARLLPSRSVVDGDITFDGRSIFALSGPELRRYRSHGVATIFQDPRAHLNPVRTIGDFLVESMEILEGSPRSSSNKRARALLTEVGISDADRVMQQYPHQLSGGLLQRVLIAGALALEPKALIADEPTTALDLTTQAQVMGVFEQLREKRGLAILLITHDLTLAASVCDAVTVLYAGQVMETGKSSIMDHSPRHPYTVALLAARPAIEATLGRLPVIPGQPQAAFEITTPGCVFASRCAHKLEQCEAGPIPMVDLGATGIRCVRPEVTAAFDLQNMLSTGPRTTEGRVEAAGTVAALEAKGLSKVYGGRHGQKLVLAVKDISFQLPDGDVLALVGESGSGKTTTARMIAGLTDPTSGEILVFGKTSDSDERERMGRRERARLVQMVFQDSYGSLDPSQAIGAGLVELLALHGLRGRGARSARTSELMESVGLAPRLGDRRPRELSGGQRQRVAIARALAVEPRVLVLDEPVASLDVSIQAQIINLLAELRAQLKLSMLLISHDLSIVRQLADSVIVMRDGVEVESGSTDDVLNRPQDPYTRILRDSVPRPGWHHPSEVELRFAEAHRGGPVGEQPW
jgi:peptide/nickel transport system ATP-binding protein